MSDVPDLEPQLSQLAELPRLVGEAPPADHLYARVRRRRQRRARRSMAAGGVLVAAAVAFAVVSSARQERAKTPTLGSPSSVGTVVTTPVTPDKLVPSYVPDGFTRRPDRTEVRTGRATNGSTGLQLLVHVIEYVAPSQRIEITTSAGAIADLDLLQRENGGTFITLHGVKALHVARSDFTAFYWNDTRGVTVTVVAVNVPDDEVVHVAESL